MDNNVFSPTTSSTPLSSVAIIEGQIGDGDGFYTDTIPLTTDGDTFHMTADRKSLIIGFVLGIITLILLVIGLIFAIKLYRRKLKKEMAKERYMEELSVENNGKQWMLGNEAEGGSHNNKLSILPQSLSGTTNSSKKSHLSSLLDPGSQFSLAVQRASEIPNSPTT